jgi:hypothetical protein
LALGVLLVPAAANAETAKEVIEKAIKAHGGATNLKKASMARMTFKGTLSQMNLEIPVEGETIYQLPDKEKSVLTLSVLGQNVKVVQIVNGTKTRVTANGVAAPVPDAQKDELVEGARLQAVTNLTPLLDEKAYELRLIDKADKVMGKDVIGVLVKPKKGKEVKLFFEKDKHRLVKLARKGVSQAGDKDVDQEVIFSDFKQFDGSLHPTKTEQFADGKKVTTTKVLTFKVLDKVDKKEFDTSE